MTCYQVPATVRPSPETHVLQNAASVSSVPCYPTVPDEVIGQLRSCLASEDGITVGKELANTETRFKDSSKILTNSTPGQNSSANAGCFLGRSPGPRSVPRLKFIPACSPSDL